MPSRPSQSSVPTAVITDPEARTRPSDAAKTPQTVNTFTSEPSSRAAVSGNVSGNASGQPSARSGSANSSNSDDVNAALNVKIQAGDRIAGRYDVLDILGEGGMGIVYRCVDRHTGNEVALKQVIIPKGSSADDYLSWFYKEARAQALLNHPGIVRATDFGQLVGGSPFLAMDLVPGHSLHDLGQVQLSYPIIWSIIDQLLDALAHAHARLVVHGDLKPSNVLVEPRENRPPRMHILDFGLAWLKEDPHDERLDGAKAMIFLPHAGAGTPGYMAPEQIQHQTHHVCGATDLYSVGCLIHRLLCGKAPFSGSTKELLQKHAYEEVPALVLATPAPDGAVAFARRLLEKRPWDRFEFAAEARREWKKVAPSLPLRDGAWDFPLPPQQPPADAPTPVPSSSGPRQYQSVSAGPTGLLGIRPSPLVGRDELRSQLEKVANEVAQGKGPPHRLVLLLGPAGVGKSRLAEWLTCRVHEEGQMVPLTVRYRRVRSASNGMLGAVSRYFNFEQADRLTIESSLMDRWRPSETDTELRAWIAGAAEWLRPTPPGAEHPVGASGVRFRVESPGVRQQVSRFTIRKLAAGRPLLFFLDDLHHAPQTVVDGLLKIHKAEQDQRIFMVATVRTEDVQLGSPIADAIRRLRKELDGDVLQVLPMNTQETCELMRASLPLDAQAAEEAARRSRGFPLFALQQLHAWAHAGDFTLSEGSYTLSEKVLEMRPSTTADLWDTRLAGLTEDESLAAVAVATLGIDMRVIVIFALLEALNLSPAACIEALRRAEIILPRGSERYTWPHALLQEHLMRRLQDNPEASRVFEAAANALEHHPLVGTRRVMRQRMVNLLGAHLPDQAANVFFEFLSQSRNGTHQPRTTLSDLDLLKGQLQGVSLARYDRWRAEVLRYAGELAEAQRLALRASKALTELKQDREAAHCFRLLGQLESQTGNLTQGLRLVEQALDVFTKLNYALGIAHCEAAMADIQYLQGEYTMARRSARSSADHFLTAERPIGRGQSLLRLCWIAHSEGRTRRARRLTLEARENLERSGYRPGLAETTLLIAHIEHRISNFFTAMQKTREAIVLFDALGMKRGKADGERLLATIEIDTDDLNNAQVHAESATAAYQEMGERAAISDSQLLSAQARLGQRDDTSAFEYMQKAKQGLGQEVALRQHWHLTEAWYELQAGTEAKALTALRQASKCFGEQSQAGEHSSQLLARLSRMAWGNTEALGLIESWRQAIDDHDRRDRE